MEDFLKDNKFEAVRYRHEDQSRLLLAIAATEHRIYGGFLTLQLTFGGFLTQFRIDSLASGAGLFLIDCALAGVTTKLLFNLYKRRKEVVATIINCNRALGYDEANVYGDRKINSSFKTRTSFLWFFIGLMITLVGISVILFAAVKISNAPAKKILPTRQVSDIVDTTKTLLRTIMPAPRISDSLSVGTP